MSTLEEQAAERFDQLENLTLGQIIPEDEMHWMIRLANSIDDDNPLEAMRYLIKSTACCQMDVFRNDPSELPCYVRGYDEEQRHAKESTPEPKPTTNAIIEDENGNVLGIDDDGEILFQRINGKESNVTVAQAMRTFREIAVSDHSTDPWRLNRFLQIATKELDYAEQMHCDMADSEGRNWDPITRESDEKPLRKGGRSRMEGGQ